MHWTKKHDEAAISFRLTPSSERLYRYINRRTKGFQPEELEIDLRDFNKWIIKKRGKGYDRKTLKTAIAQLFDKSQGLIVEWKQITWYYYKIIVKPVTFLGQEKVPPLGKVPEGESLKPSPCGGIPQDTVQQQQHSINSMKDAFNEIGMKFDRDALNRIWRLSGKCCDRVMKAIELLLYRNSASEIKNPHGFIINSLKYNWGEGFDLYYSPEIPKFTALSELREFVTDIKKRLSFIA